MSRASPFIQKLAEMDRTGQPVVAVTLVGATGSTPQDVGSKMLVDHNGLVWVRSAVDAWSVRRSSGLKRCSVSPMLPTRLC